MSTITYETTDRRNFDAKILNDAYASFLKHAPAIFDDPTINPATGETIYASIETKDAWERLIKGVQSRTGQHNATVTIARNEAGKVIGFAFGIYHENSNSANITYAGIDEEFRNKNILTQLNGQALKAIHALAQEHGHDAASGVFVERANKVPGAVPANALALNDWRSPLLIPDQDGVYQRQDLRLIVKWGAGQTDEDKATTVSLFAQDFYALYSEPLVNGGVPANNNKFYAGGLTFTTGPEQMKDLIAMQIDAHEKYGVPLRNPKSLVRNPAKPANKIS